MHVCVQAEKKGRKGDLQLMVIGLDGLSMLGPVCRMYPKQNFIKKVLHEHLTLHTQL